MYTEMEVDARAMVELQEEEFSWEELKKSLIERHLKTYEKRDKELPVNTDPDFMKNYIRELKEKLDQEANENALSGASEQSASIAKVNPSQGLGGKIGTWIKEHPVETAVIGAVVVTGVYMTYKYYRREFSSYKSRKRKKRRKESEDLLKGEGLSRSSQAEELFTETEKEVEQISKEETNVTPTKELITGIAATIGGTVAGAALGDSALLAALPLLITGIRNHSLKLTLAGTGMALVAGYKNQKTAATGNFLTEAVDRIKTYLKDFASKLFPAKAKPQTISGLNGKYYHSMLGAIPISPDKFQMA